MEEGIRTAGKIIENLGKVIKGKPEVLERVVITLLSGGHILMEDVPGVGKTTLAKSLACSIRGAFRRIQFTPDLLPADILGSSIYNPKEGTFEFRQGPVFANILLTDEINRASPRTQSSLLEAMNEHQATIEGERYPLPSPFLVIATENPIEFHGTYPLPEAQLDRFMVKLELGYPDTDHEVEILHSQDLAHPIESIEPVVDLEEITKLQEMTRQVHVDDALTHYIVEIVANTRAHPQLKLGSSPRGSLMLYQISKAVAFMRGRKYVVPDDIKEMAVSVLGHRIILETKSKYSGVSKEKVIEEILDRVPVPT